MESGQGQSVTPGTNPVAQTTQTVQTNPDGTSAGASPQEIQDALAQGLMPNVAQIPTYEEMNKVQLIDDAEKIQREQADEIERRRREQAAQAEAQRQAALQAQAAAEGRRGAGGGSCCSSGCARFV